MGGIERLHKVFATQDDLQPAIATHCKEMHELRCLGPWPCSLGTAHRLSGWRAYPCNSKPHVMQATGAMHCQYKYVHALWHAYLRVVGRLEPELPVWDSSARSENIVSK